MNVANPFEAAARAVKVQKLSVIIDRAFDALKIALSEERYERVAAMGNPGWASAAAQAQVPFPSEATKEDTIALYGMRVKAAFDAQISASIAGALKSAGGAGR